MTASTILSSVRTPLSNALSTVAANVYAFVPETPSVPFCVNVPDSPYLELETINKSTLHTKINLVISCGCLLYTSPSPRDRQKSRMPSSA